jgi:hypothetical protein
LRVHRRQRRGLGEAPCGGFDENSKRLGVLLLISAGTRIGADMYGMILIQT